VAAARTLGEFLCETLTNHLRDRCQTSRGFHQGISFCAIEMPAPFVWRKYRCGSCACGRRPSRPDRKNVSSDSARRSAGGTTDARQRVESDHDITPALPRLARSNDCAHARDPVESAVCGVATPHAAAASESSIAQTVLGGHTRRRSVWHATDPAGSKAFANQRTGCQI
jgi:hypothetical protein